MMKRLVFSILMILALTAGAAYAQSTLNTSPPGPTQQQEPGLTNNNLPNPGNPVPTPEAQAEQQPLQEQGTVEGTATESMTDQQGANTTGNLDTTSTTTTTGTTAAEMDTTTTTDTSNLSDTNTLPGTASKLPLVGLIGLLALAAAFVVRRF